MANVRYRYQTLEFRDTDIHLRTLRDRQQFDDPSGEAESLGVSPASWSLGGVLWAAGEVLARKMDHYELAGKRVLEVGCGIGLASLLMNQQKVDVTASDYNPNAGVFLTYNSRLNNCRDIPFFCSNWSDDASTHGLFDVIIGSDLLYEPDQAIALAGFIDQHASPAAKVIIVDPRRGNVSAFCREMARLGYQGQRIDYTPCDEMTQQFSGLWLEFSRC